MILNFFIWCSGCNSNILSQCPTEKTKFAGIGATIFMTALFASISGGYALFFTFNNYIISVVAGLFWGAVIFNLDRYIVSSIRKTGVFKQELIMALPRLAIAILLGITISKPLELRLFGDTINKRLYETDYQVNVDCERSFNKRRDSLSQQKKALEDQEINAKKNIYSGDPVITDINNNKKEKEADNESIDLEISANNKIIDKNKILVSRQIDANTGKRSKYWKYNDEAKRRIRRNKELYDMKGTNIETLSMLEDSSNSRRTILSTLVSKTESQYASQISGIQQQMDSLNNKREGIIAECSKKTKGNKDVLDRLIALGQLKSFGNTVWIASLLITLVFIFLEIAPITVKLLAKRGPYEDKLDAIEAMIAEEEKIKKENKFSELHRFSAEMNDIQEKRIKSRLTIEDDKIASEIKSNKELLQKISEKHVALTEQYIDDWYKEQATKTQKTALSAQEVFTHKLWRVMGNLIETIYVFNINGLGIKEMVLFVNGVMQKGEWEYNNGTKIIRIHFNGTTKEYEVMEAGTTFLKLQNEFETVEFQEV